MKNNTLSPLFLQSVLGPFPIIGSTASAIPLDIKNPNKTAMLIDQIRFSFRDELSRNIATAYYTAMMVDILLGSIPLTNKFVTLGALAPRYLGSAAAIDNLFGPQGDSGLVWHLPKPLYVPPDVQLSLHARRQMAYPGDTTGLGTIPALAVSIVGRSLPEDFPVPGSIPIPWVTQTQCEDSATRFVSGDGDLVNSNDSELHVTQFVGVNCGTKTDPGVPAGPTPADIRVQMSLSNGTLLIRDQVPFYLAFPSDRGILPVNARLQPGMFVRLELESSVPAGLEAHDGCGVTAIAMHGYRSIQTPGTLG